MGIIQQLSHPPSSNAVTCLPFAERGAPPARGDTRG
jgi:hypothetical protein